MKRFIIVSAVLGIALVAQACAPGVSFPVPAPSPTVSPEQSNLTFLVSDQPNDIGDFEHLNVTISSIGVQMAGDNSSWLQFSPYIGTVDLTELQGKNAQEIWSGNITPGQYNKVFIYVSEVEGILNGGTDNGTASVKLPSGKLQISTPFMVSDNTAISFVFDVTVIKAGNSGKYVLKPQIAESGAGQEFTEVKAAQSQEQERERERSRLRLHLQGPSQPGAASVLVVMSHGKPVEGAAVTVNGQDSGVTDSAGMANITIPLNTAAVKIVATIGQNSGELELEFGQDDTGTGIETGDASENVTGERGNRRNQQGGNKPELPEGQGEEVEQEEPPPVPHTLQGREDCLACHGAGGIEPFPANHAGRTSDICLTCHQPSE